MTLLLVPDRRRYRDVLRSVSCRIGKPGSGERWSDLAAVLAPDALELVIEDGLRRGLLTTGQLRWRAAVRSGRGVAGSARIAPLLERRIGGTDSGWEVRVEQILRDAGLPTPVRQMRVDTLDGPRWVDLGCPGPPVVASEYDSDRWHTGVARRRADAARRNALRLRRVHRRRGDRRPRRRSRPVGPPRRGGGVRVRVAPRR